MMAALSTASPWPPHPHDPEHPGADKGALAAVRLLLDDQSVSVTAHSAVPVKTPWSAPAIHGCRGSRPGRLVQS